MSRRSLVHRHGYDLKSHLAGTVRRWQLAGGIATLITLLVAVPVSTLLQSTAQAAGEQITMGMPFAGQWAYNVPTTAACGTTAHPSCHPNVPSTGSLSGYHWAVDYYQPDGTDVKINGASAQGTVTFSSVAGSGSCGDSMVVVAKANNVTAGQIYVTHLNGSVVSASLANEASIGTVSNGGAPNYNGCFGVDHVHFSYKNTVSNHSCYKDYSVVGGNTAGMDVAYAAAVGVLGSTNTGVQQACTSIPSGQTSDDFNMDGKDDIAWYAYSSNATVTALISNGTTFAGSPLVSGIGKPTWAGTGDFNNDGRGDIAWYHESNHTLYVFKAGSNGVWTVSGILSGLGKPDWAGVGDFNSDGLDDIAWYEGWNNGTVTALISNGASFSGSPLVSGMGVPTWAGVGDFNNDGRGDIGWYHESNHTLSVAKAGSNGVWTVSPMLSGLGKPDWSGTGDFNMDGKDDIAWYEHWNSGTVKALISNGAGFSTGSPLVSGIGKPTWAGVGDFNNDNRSDIGWYHESNHTLYVFKAGSNGVWTVGPVMTSVGKPDWAGAT